MPARINATSRRNRLPAAPTQRMPRTVMRRGKHLTTRRPARSPSVADAPEARHRPRPTETRPQDRSRKERAAAPRHPSDEPEERGILSRFPCACPAIRRARELTPHSSPLPQQDRCARRYSGRRRASQVKTVSSTHRRPPTITCERLGCTGRGCDRHRSPRAAGKAPRWATAPARSRGGRARALRQTEETTP